MIKSDKIKLYYRCFAINFYGEKKWPNSFFLLLLAGRDDVNRDSPTLLEKHNISTFWNSKHSFNKMHTVLMQLYANKDNILKM